MIICAIINKESPQCFFFSVKVRFQNPQTSQRYTSTVNALVTIVREEKFVGLYKGVTSPLVCLKPSPTTNMFSDRSFQATVAFLNGLIFSSYRFFLKLQLDHSGAIPSLTQIALAGAGSGIVTSYAFRLEPILFKPIVTRIITTPVELIKIRQQSSLTPTSTLQVASKIYRDGGISGLYRGLGITALRELSYGPYFFAVCPLDDFPSDELM